MPPSSPPRSKWTTELLRSFDGQSSASTLLKRWRRKLFKILGGEAWAAREADLDELQTLARSLTEGLRYAERLSVAEALLVLRTSSAVDGVLLADVHRAVRALARSYSAAIDDYVKRAVEGGGGGGVDARALETALEEFTACLGRATRAQGPRPEDCFRALGCHGCSEHAVAFRGALRSLEDRLPEEAWRRASEALFAPKRWKAWSRDALVYGVLTFLAPLVAAAAWRRLRGAAGRGPPSPGAPLRRQGGAELLDGESPRTIYSSTEALQAKWLSLGLLLLGGLQRNLARPTRSPSQLWLESFERHPVMQAGRGRAEFFSIASPP